jgi:predicted Zn-dependent protease
MFNAVVGDVTVLLMGGGNSVLNSLDAGHSQAAEARADQHAFTALRKQGLSPVVFAAVIARMSAGRTPDQTDDWMRSHPADQQRINAAHAAALSEAQQ